MALNFWKKKAEPQEEAFCYDERGKRIPAPEDGTPGREEQQAQIQRLMTADRLYCRISRVTGEPYVSGYLQQKNGTVVQGPFYLHVWDQPPEPIEGTQAAEISGGRQGILAFLGDQFYLNGIQGIRYGESAWIIPRESLVRLSEKAAAEEPGRNEDLVLYMLLTAQCDSEQSQAARNLYLKRFAACLKGAEVLLPVRSLEPSPEWRSGRAALQENTRSRAAVCRGSSGRDVAEVFTDRKRMYQLMDGDWGFALRPLGELLETWDCQLDRRPGCPGMGVYLSRENYAQLMALL